MLSLEELLNPLPHPLLEALHTPALHPQSSLSPKQNAIPDFDSASQTIPHNEFNSHEVSPLLTQPGHIQSSTPSPDHYCTSGNLHQLPFAQALPLLLPLRSHTSSPALSIIEHNVCLNQKTTLRFLFCYPLGTTIKYSETRIEGSMGHLFEISPHK